MNINKAEAEQVLARLRTVRGHVAAIERMIETEKSYDEVMIQLMAVRSAVTKATIVLAQQYVSDSLIVALEDNVSPEVVNKAIENLINIHHKDY